MSNSENCLRCPREITYHQGTETIAALREALNIGSEAALDQQAAEDLAVLIKESGLLPGVELDANSMRHLLLGGFELIDQLEEKMREKRHEETQFCVGALRMRAKDARTEYTVAICRSPVQDSLHTGDVQQALVQKRSIN